MGLPSVGSRSSSFGVSMPIPLPTFDATALSVALAHLDDLWFQVGGTLCNLTCRHYFISCSPYNHAFGFLGLDAVRRLLEESVALGVKEYYFTGGEPFQDRVTWWTSWN
jgi:hypothetical protein